MTLKKPYVNYRVENITGYLLGLLNFDDLQFTCPS